MMPIVSRSLESVQPSAAGTVLARFLAVDSRGREWRRSRSRFVDEAAATAASDAYDWTAQLEDLDEQVGLAFVEAGGDPEVYAREDLTIQEWRRRVAKRWWNTPIEGSSSADLTFLCLTADYITIFTAAQITSALGISEAKATKGLDRAIDLRDVTCPAMAASDAEQEDAD